MAVEYRVVYVRNGFKQYRDGFPNRDINWMGYFHNIKPSEIIGWQERDIGGWRKSDD